MPLSSLSDVTVALQLSESGARNRGGATAATANAAEDPNFFDRFAQRSANYADGESMRLPYAGNTKGEGRFPFVLTSDLWIQEGKYLQLHAGPKAAAWSLPIRAGEEEVKSGHARFASPRRTGHGNNATWLGEPRVTFSFQSGNILPIPTQFGTVKAPHGLVDFHYFIDLMNQPPIIPTGPKEGAHNYVWVFHTSLMFPDLLIKGYIDPQGINWTEDAEAGAEVMWDASFIVHESSPNIFSPEEMIRTYESTMLNIRQF